MLKFRMKIGKEDENNNVFVRVEELRHGKWHFVDSYESTSQNVSSMLVYEREKVQRGDYMLEIKDCRERFMMV